MIRDILAFAGSAVGFLACAGVMYHLGDETLPEGSGHKYLVDYANEGIRICGGAVGISFVSLLSVRASSRDEA